MRWLSDVFFYVGSDDDAEVLRAQTAALAAWTQTLAATAAAATTTATNDSSGSSSKEAEWKSSVPFSALFRSPADMEIVLRDGFELDEAAIERFGDLSLSPLFPVCMYEIVSVCERERARARSQQSAALAAKCHTRRFSVRTICAGWRRCVAWRPNRGIL